MTGDTAFDNILKALTVITPLLLGVLAAIKGTKVWRRKKIEDAVKEKRDELAAKERELDERDAKAMKELTEKVEVLSNKLIEQGEALTKERQERQQQSAEFFRILQTFRNREWKLTEHVHVLETLLRANGIQFDPLPADLRELPPEINQFFRRATDPQPPTTTN